MVANKPAVTGLHGSFHAAVLESRQRQVAGGGVTAAIQRLSFPKWRAPGGKLHCDDWTKVPARAPPAATPVRLPVALGSVLLPLRLLDGDLLAAAQYRQGAASWSELVWSTGRLPDGSDSLAAVHSSPMSYGAAAELHTRLKLFGTSYNEPWGGSPPLVAAVVEDRTWVAQLLHRLTSLGAVGAVNVIYTLVAEGEDGESEESEAEAEAQQQQQQAAAGSAGAGPSGGSPPWNTGGAQAKAKAAAATAARAKTAIAAAKAKAAPAALPGEAAAGQASKAVARGRAADAAAAATAEEAAASIAQLTRRIRARPPTHVLATVSLARLPSWMLWEGEGGSLEELADGDGRKSGDKARDKERAQAHRGGSQVGRDLGRGPLCGALGRVQSTLPSQASAYPRSPLTLPLPPPPGGQVAAGHLGPGRGAGHPAGAGQGPHRGNRLRRHPQPPGHARRGGGRHRQPRGAAPPV